jgi:hypothetical protein
MTHSSADSSSMSRSVRTTSQAPPVCNRGPVPPDASDAIETPQVEQGHVARPASPQHSPVAARILPAPEPKVQSSIKRRSSELEERPRTFHVPFSAQRSLFDPRSEQECRREEEAREARARLAELFAAQDEIYMRARTMALEQILTRRAKAEEPTAGLCDSNCSICQESNSAGMSASLPCKHRFHIKCVASWLVQKPECPNCRASTSR